MTQGRRSILITRPEQASEATATRIAALGYRPMIAPLFAVHRRTVVIPDGVRAIVVTSGNAIESLPPVDLPVFAVGDATAERARARGFADVRSAGRDAVALAALVANSADPPGPLLLASGARQGFSLAADLRVRGFRVIRRVCYAALPAGRFPAIAAAAIRSGDLHAILFLSTETATTFVRLLPPELRDRLASIAALAIGQQAAHALEPLPWLRICRAENPTLDDVLALI